MALTFIKKQTHIDFVGNRKKFYLLSVILIAIGLLSLIIKGGPRYGIDFAGGTLIQIKFAAPVTDEEVKKALAGVDLPGLTVQQFGSAADSEYLIRASTLQEKGDPLRAAVMDALGSALPDSQPEVQRVEMVGPKVGADLRGMAIEALFYATLLIAIYISGRFEHRWLMAAVMAVVLGGALYFLGRLGISKSWLVLIATILTCVLCWKLHLIYALGAVVGLVHDILITIGFLSIFNIEIDLTIVAALLTIIGYSLNDTIVVYDRIRENTSAKKYPTLMENINASINQTLSRTLLTSLTTLLVLVVLLFLGGSIIHDFALTMIVGVVTGTYSSIFISSPMLLTFGATNEPVTPQKKKVAFDKQGAVV